MGALDRLRAAADEGHVAAMTLVAIYDEYPATRQRVTTAPCPIDSREALVAREDEGYWRYALRVWRDMYGQPTVRFPHRAWVQVKAGEPDTLDCPCCGYTGPPPRMPRPPGPTSDCSGRPRHAPRRP